MPAQILVGPIKDTIPLGWTSLNIHHLASTNVAGKYAFLKIKFRHKHHACQVNRLKMLLEDGRGNVIDFFAFGQVADDLKACEKGDVLLCLEFEIEESPGHCHRPYQIIADDTRTEKSSIWVSKPLNSPASDSFTPDVENAEIGVHKQPGGTAEKKKHQNYNYRVLLEVKVNTVVDVYGLVKFVKPAVKGKGSDYYCVVGLIDPSLAGREEEKLTCVFFHREPDNLPKVEEGDVLRLHRLKIQTYQGGKQGYNGPGFQWLAFHGSVDNRTFSSASYTFEEQDQNKVDGLLDWWSKKCEYEVHLPQSRRSEVKNIRPLASVTPKNYFDLICQAIRVCVLEPDVCRLIRVWDGTKFDGQLKEVAEGELNHSLEEDGLLVKASAGLAVDVFFFDNHAHEASHVKPGDCLLLTNVHSSVVSGLVELTIHGGGQQFRRGVQVLPADNTEAQTLKAKLDSHIKKVGGDSNNCSLGITSAAQSGQGTSGSTADKCEKDVVSKDDGNSQGFSLRENITDDDKSGTDLTLVNYSGNRASPVIRTGESAHEMDNLPGRKDVPSKNKSFRRRMLFNADNVRGSSFVSFVQDKRVSNKPVGHLKEDNTLSVWRNLDAEDIANEEKRSYFSEDRSQLICLSIFNNSDDGQKNSKSALSLALQQGHDISKVKRRISFNKDITQRISNNICEVESPTRDGLSVHDKQKDQGNVVKEVITVDDISSQESFVTVPSPKLLRYAGRLSPEKHQGSAIEARKTQLAPAENCAEKQRQAEKRTGEALSNDSDKRIKLTPERKNGGERRSKKKVQQKFVEKLDEEDVNDSANNRNIFPGRGERDKEQGKERKEIEEVMKSHREYEEGLSQSFSQNHLEILDSEMLYFDSNEFSQDPKANSENGDPKESESVIQETESPVHKPSEPEKKILLRPRRKKESFRAKDSQDAEQRPCGSTKPRNESAETAGSQPACSSHVIDLSERSALGQESQDFLQINTGDSQVSSSTDSQKSLSQPRCMLHTASVVLDHLDVPLSTLQEVLDNPPPHKFRIQAKVDRVEPRPSAPQDLVHFLCSQCKFFSRMESRENDSMVFDGENMICPRCVQPPSTLRPVSVLVLQLSDERNTISASVWDKNADKFFGGISPQQLLNDGNCFRQVQQSLTDLCPPGSSLESRPVLECCVFSYFVDGDVKIQIFDTSLV